MGWLQLACCVLSCFSVPLFAIPGTVSASVRGILQARILEWDPPPGDLPDQEIELLSLTSPAL